MKLSEKVKVMMVGVMIAVVGLGLVVPVGTAWGADDPKCPEGTIRKDAPVGPGETTKTYAQCNVPWNEGGNTSTEGRTATSYVNQIINVVIGILGVVAIAIIVLSGVQIATANGDPSKVQKGTKSIVFAVVGLIVAALAYAIVNFVLTNALGGQ